MKQVMTDEPIYRQRLLSRLGEVAGTLDELGHLPPDRLLAIDVSMNDAEHTEWLRKAISDSLKDNVPLHDGEEVFAELQRWLVKERQREHAQGSVRGSGTPGEIAERIAELPHGQYRFTIQRMPEKQDVIDSVDALFPVTPNDLLPELAGKTDAEIRERIGQWATGANEDIAREVHRLRRHVAWAQAAGFLSRDELCLLAYELILARFGADRGGTGGE